MLAIRTRIALLPVAFALSAAPAAPRVEGYAFTLEVVSSTETDKLIMTFKFAGENMRLDPDLASMGGNDPSAAQMMAGAYLLTQPGGKVAFILPGMGMAMRTDANTMTNKDPAGRKCDGVTVEDLGVGEQILGAATRKYRMKARLQAKGDLPAGDEVTEAWVATSLAGTEGMFKKFAKAFGDQIGNADCPEEFSKFPEGFPLRMKTTKPGAKGVETEDMQVTSFRKMTFTETDFIIPPGMRVMDGNPFGKRAP